jgi:hypothetical protein
MSTVQNSVEVRDAMNDAWEAAIGPGARIRLYDGAKPASCAAAETGTMLVEWVLPSDYSPNSTGGVKTLSGSPILGTAAAGGTVTHYRIYNSAGTKCHEQGSVTATGGGGDTTIDNVVIANLQSVNIQGWQRTAPGA